MPVSVFGCIWVFVVWVWYFFGRALHTWTPRNFVTYNRIEFSQSTQHIHTQIQLVTIVSSRKLLIRFAAEWTTSPPPLHPSLIGFAYNTQARKWNVIFITIWAVENLLENWMLSICFVNIFISLCWIYYSLFVCVCAVHAMQCVYNVLKTQMFSVGTIGKRNNHN